MENVKEAIQILVEAKANVAALLKGSHDLAAIGIDTGLTNLINKLNFITGTTTFDTKEQFSPVTDFMGEKIEPVKTVVKEEIVPTPNKQAAFLKKVDDLQAQFPNLLNEKILESYVVKEDILAIRGVAKRAGLEDFKKAEINGAFLDQIREALKNQAAAKVFEDKQNEDINK